MRHFVLTLNVLYFRFPLTLTNTVPPAGTLQEALRLIHTACSCVTINSDYFREEYYVIGLCNRKDLCFLCGGN